MSVALFGNRHFAEVVSAIARLVPQSSDLVTTREIASLVGVSDSTVRPVVLRLVDAGLLVALPKAGHARATQYYQRVEASTWDTLTALAGLPALDVQP